MSKTSSRLSESGGRRNLLVRIDQKSFFFSLSQSAAVCLKAGSRN